MTRAALRGALMGLLLGGAILAVLALQVSVVDWPEEGEALAAPDPAIAPDVPDEVVAASETNGPSAQLAEDPVQRLPQEGPAETAPPEIARLATSARATPHPVVPEAQGTPPSAPPQMTLLSEAGGFDRPEVLAEVLAVPPPEAAAIRGLRLVPAASVPLAPVGLVPLEVNTVPLSSDRGVAARGETPFATRPVLPERDPLAASGASTKAVRSEAYRAAPAAIPESIAAAVSAATAPAQGAQSKAGQSRPRAIAAAAPAAIAAPQAQPDPRAGTARSPMILWLVTGLPEGAAAPDWAVAVDASAENGAVVALPPLDRPEALAGFASGLPGEARALALDGGHDWPAVLLAPVLDLPALQELPVFYPAGAAPDTVGLLRDRAGRSMPVYTVLDPAAPAAETGTTLAAAGERAARDGIVVLEMPADPALLSAVDAWQTGTELPAARLSDLFGG